MRTEKLFYIDAYQKEFTAQVLSCQERKGGWEILLDRTCFYPEGGGQSADQGQLFLLDSEAEPVTVLDVQETGEGILHLTDGSLKPQAKVQGRIDWPRRFDLMQQHSGEHIVSGLVHTHFGYHNVGFHMGAEVITIDFDGMLSMQDLREIENEANDIIWQNLETQITFPSPQDLETLAYRSKKELQGEVRIVTFPGADVCACCGTHVARTGEIGLVRLLSLAKFHEGVRLEMIAGKRAAQYLQRLDEQNRQISVQLSAKPLETAKALERLSEETYTLRGKIRQLEDRYIRSLADQYAGAQEVLLFVEELGMEALQKLGDALSHVSQGRCAVFSHVPDGSYKYVIAQQGGDLRVLTKEMNQALCGRGGGKPFFVQGSVSAAEEEIRAFFSSPSLPS